MKWKNGDAEPGEDLEGGRYAFRDPKYFPDICLEILKEIMKDLAVSYNR
jgi:hypothetical protein